MANKTPTVMDDEDAVNAAKPLKIARLEDMLSDACKLLQREGKLKDASIALRDWWGNRKAKLRRTLDSKTSGEKWKD